MIDTRGKVQKKERRKYPGRKARNKRNTEHLVNKIRMIWEELPCKLFPATSLVLQNRNRTGAQNNQFTHIWQRSQFTHPWRTDLGLAYRVYKETSACKRAHSPSMAVRPSFLVAGSYHLWRGKGASCSGQSLKYGGGGGFRGLSPP